MTVCSCFLLCLVGCIARFFGKSDSTGSWACYGSSGSFDGRYGWIHNSPNGETSRQSATNIGYDRYQLKL